MRLITKAVIIISYYVLEIVADKKCSNFETCGACIGFAGECVWCAKPNITNRLRCQPEVFLRNSKDWCDEKFIFNPLKASYKVVSNTSLGFGTDKPVQFQPQGIKIKLRPGALFSFKMSYKPADDFPLDVYYLLDYSYTMRKHVGELHAQARSVYKELNKFTNNVLFGVGSFVEKPDLPFANKIKQNVYSFQNHLSLTNDIKKFEDVIAESPKGSNYDDPEGGLDGLMQVMACEKVLGWRPEARRIIILFTDSTYHSAGDGKMVGAGRPNDMKCHLNGSHHYDHSLLQDYPSVSQLSHMASSGNFKIIFAALNAVKTEYELLAKQILGAGYAELKTKSNIIDIIKTAYLESVRFLRIKYTFPANVQLTLKPDCTKENFCEIKHKQTFDIDAKIKVSYCPEDPKQFIQSLEVGPTSGGLTDKLKIKLEIDCQCDCERDKSGALNSSFCSNLGTLQCGICKCNKDRYGNYCQCDESITSKTDLEKCRPSQNETSFCSNRGNCVCGKCDCNPEFSGDFCEFDDNSCKRRDDKLCSGHGSCTHGACDCGTQWTGDDCSCAVNTNECFAPYSQEICSGNGECVCGECVCRKENGKPLFSGNFCEDCDECAQKRCRELQGYTECNYWANKTYCDQLQQFNQTSNTEVQMLNKTEMNNATWLAAKWCHMTLVDDRSIVFIHIYDKSNRKLRLIIQRELEEAPKAKIYVPVGIAIGTVLIIGLLTLIVWKILVDRMDEKEYNKFMQEAKEAGFDVAENPIYQPAAVNFSNPLFQAENKN